MDAERKAAAFSPLLKLSYKNTLTLNESVWDFFIHVAEATKHED